jgi:hypothetical protein
VSEREDRRSAQTESLFRDVNERIAETAERFDSDDASFVCECDDPHCTHRIQTSLETYERVREHGATFLVSDRHVNYEIEKVVERRHGFHIVEKVKPLVRRTVQRLNPRSDPA